MNEKKQFPLEKILTTSEENYTGKIMLNSGVAKYTPIGIHVQGILSFPNSSGTVIVKEFAAEVPYNAFIVLNYKCSIANSGNKDIFYVASGTAYVPTETKT
ncbi:MAG: hypothetical protein ACP5N1_05425 [Candidatus Woesearchaeota archaeon]